MGRAKTRDLAELGALAAEVRQVVGARDELDARLDVLVPQLEAAGATWAEIGELIGKSASTAHYRWGRRSAA